MNEPLEKLRTSPAHLRPNTVEIPAIWTPEQALAVFDLLDELKEKIWTRYSGPLQGLLEEQRRYLGVNDSNIDRSATDRRTS